MRRLTSFLFAAFLALSTSAQAQAPQAQAPQAPQAGPTVESATVETSAEAAEEDEERHGPMDWIGLGVKVGYATIKGSTIANPTYQPDLARLANMGQVSSAVTMMLQTNGNACTMIDPRCNMRERSGLQISFPLYLGGDGFGWDVEPYFMFTSSANAYGAYTGPKFDIHVADPLYIGFGFGVKAAWVKADGWNYGADIYGRIPVRATLYMAKNLALVIEFAFGAGGTGYANNPVTYTVAGQSFNAGPTMNFGSSRTWDFSAGFRFP